MKTYDEIIQQDDGYYVRKPVEYTWAACLHLVPDGIVRLLRFCCSFK